MRKTKVLLIVSACLVLVGVLLCGAALAMGYNGGFGLTRDFKYVEPDEASMAKTAVEPFSGMELDIGAADLELVPGDGYALEYENLMSRPAYKVTADGRLSVKTGDDGNYLVFVGRLGIFGDSSDRGVIRVYYPTGAEMGDVKINVDMGDISVSGLSCASLNVEADLGDTELSDVKAKTAVISCDMGDVTAKRLTGGSVSGEVDCGDAFLSEIGVESLSVSSDMGDVEVTGLDAGTADIESNCGDVEITDFAVTASMDIEADMGDVTLGPRGGAEGYSMDLKTDMGDVTVMDRDCGSAAVMSAAGGVPVRAYADCGDIEVK